MSFTLIKLMTNTIASGIQGAIAITRFADISDIADAKTQISAAIGMAKKCQNWVQTLAKSCPQLPPRPALLRVPATKLATAS